MPICSGRQAHTLTLKIVVVLALVQQTVCEKSPQDCFRTTGYTYVVAQEVYSDAGNANLQTLRKQRCTDVGMKYGDVLYQTGTSVAEHVLISDWETSWAAAACGGATRPAGLLTCSGTYTPAAASSLESYLSNQATVISSSQDGGICLSLQLAASQPHVIDECKSPPPPLPPPLPPCVPPRPFPSPPPPPPSPPPSPPSAPPPPSFPPLLPPFLPAPPLSPPSPPRPPRPEDTTQLALESFCHPTCVAWALDDGRAEPTSNAGRSCAGFFANLCPFDGTAALLAGLTLPPQAPPPPFPPDASMRVANVQRVLALGGSVDEKCGTNADASPNAVCKACTDGPNLTACVDVRGERPWVLFDLGAEESAIFSVRVFLMPPAPPSPPPETPPAAPPQDPPSPLGPPTLPPFAPSPAEPPSFPCEAIRNDDSCIVGNVHRTNNGLCEDGLSIEHGGKASSSSDCSAGTDETDCGARTCVPSTALASRLLAEQGSVPPSTPAVHTLGHIEVWVSRSLALFGTRCASVDSDAVSQLHFDEVCPYGCLFVRCTETVPGVATEDAQGRYVYVRSFDSKADLRFDSIAILTRSESNLNAARQLQGKRKARPRQPVPSPRRRTAEEQHHALALELKRASESICEHRKTDVDKTATGHSVLVHLWAEASPDAQSAACTDCITKKAVSCESFMASGYGNAKERSKIKAYQQRNLLHPKEKETRKRNMAEALDRVCCRTNVFTGEKDCSRKHCATMVRNSQRSRMAHAARGLHKRKKRTLTVEQLVATDHLAPHLHPDEACRPKAKKASKAVPKSDIECFVGSMIHHVAEKHGVSSTAVSDALDSAGLDAARLLVRLSGIVSGSETGAAPGGGKAPNSAEDMPHRGGPEVGRAQRRKAADAKDQKSSGGGGGGKTQRVAPKPHGRALASARRDVAEAGAANADDNERSSGYRPASGRSPRAFHASKRSASQIAKQWLFNSSAFVHAVHRRAVAAEASGLVPYTHQPKTPLMHSYASAAADAAAAVVANDASPLRTAALAFQAAAGLAAQGRTLAAGAEDSAAAGASAGRARRRASAQYSQESVSTFFDEVDRAVERMHGRRALQQARDATSSGSTASQMSLSWVATAVDWKAASDEIERVGSVLTRRILDHVAQSEQTERPVRGSLETKHKTGWLLLDVNVPPSRLGNNLRSWALRLRKEEGAEDAHRRLRAHAERYQEHDGLEGRPIVRRALAVSAGGGSGVSALVEGMEEVGMRGSSARKLFDLFASNAGTLPVATLGRAYNKYYQPEQSDEPWLEALLRYVVYDTALCYLYGPGERKGTFLLGDGSNPVKTFRTEKLCFPGVYLAPGRMSSFRSILGVDEDFDFEELEYETACHSDAVRAVLTQFGTSLAFNPLTSPSFGLVLRFAEGVDSISNMVQSGRHAGLNSTESAAYVVCATAQLGGLIFSIFITTSIIFLCAVTPLFGLCFRRGAEVAIELGEEAIQEQVDIAEKDAKEKEQKSAENDIFDRTELDDEEGLPAPRGQRRRGQYNGL